MSDLDLDELVERTRGAQPPNGATFVWTIKFEFADGQRLTGPELLRLFSKHSNDFAVSLGEVLQGSPVDGHINAHFRYPGQTRRTRRPR